MRIGVDAACWANARGYGRFTREIVRAMAALAPGHEFACLLDERAAAAFDLRAANVRPVMVPQRASPTTAAAAFGYRSPADILRFTRAVSRERFDVFFSPSIYTYFPLPIRLPAVMTVHDAIADRYPKLTLPDGRARLFWRLKVKAALWQARLVLTVSDFAAREISDVHGVPASRIRVALEAPSPAYRPSESPSDVAAEARRVGVPAGAQWLTYVGGFNPHKNLDVLIRAHADVARRLTQPLWLVMIGAVEGDAFYGNLSALRDLTRSTGTADRILWPGFLTDDRIRLLHAGAIALVLPSQNEGFGLPAVEAAACGTPVVATNASPLPQLLEGGGIFVPPGDEHALVTAIEALATNESLRRRLGDRARQRAADLSWPRGARAALDALEEAAA